MNIKRPRGRSHRSTHNNGGGGGAPRQYGGNVPLNRNHVFDSSGPDLRIRGTAQQLYEKYLQLGRDATGVGDRVMAESYFQYAEHYFRILGAINLASQQHYQNTQQQNPQQQHYNNNHYNGQRYRDENGQQDDQSQPYDDQGHPDQREIPIAAASES